MHSLRALPSPLPTPGRSRRGQGWPKAIAQRRVAPLTPVAESGQSLREGSCRQLATGGLGLVRLRHPGQLVRRALVGGRSMAVTCYFTSQRWSTLVVVRRHSTAQLRPGRPRGGPMIVSRRSVGASGQCGRRGWLVIPTPSTTNPLIRRLGDLGWGVWMYMGRWRLTSVSARRGSVSVRRRCCRQMLSARRPTSTQARGWRVVLSPSLALAAGITKAVRHDDRQRRSNLLPMWATRRRYRRDRCELSWHLMRMTTYGGALSALHPIVQPIFDSLAEGLEESQRYHTEKSYLRSDDPHFYLHMARRHACEELGKQGVHARLVDDSAALNMSGILLYHGGLAVRVLHTQRDGRERVQIPVPGHSQLRQDFWGQAPAIPGLDTDNVLLLWLDNEGTLEDPMIMIRPLGGDHQRSSLRLEWRGKVSREMGTRRAEDLVDLEPDWLAERLA